MGTYNFEVQERFSQECQILMKKEILWSMTAPQQSMTPYAQSAKAQLMSAKPSVAKFALIGFISNVSVSNRLISVLSGKMSHFSAPNANPDQPKRPNPKKWQKRPKHQK